MCRFAVFICAFACVLSSLCAEVSTTFAMIKPRAVKEQHIGEIIKQIEKADLKIAALKMTRLSEEQAKAFYKEHEGKPFFAGLIEKMTSGPVVAMVISSQDDTVKKVRTIIGATNPAKAEQGTIRSLYGKDITENAIHSSDSPESATREIQFFFTPAEIYAQ